MAVEKRVDRWDAVIARTPVAVGQIIAKTTADGYAGSQLRVHVRTAFLKNSGRMEIDRDRFEGTIFYSAHYAAYHHEPTRFWPGNPFLRDGVEAAVPTMIAMFTQLERALG